MPLIVGLILFLAPYSLKENLRKNEALLLHVGQGQWFIYNDGLSCWHLDQGGEWFPLLLVESFCQNRNHRILLSHTDWDHINFNSWWMRKYFEQSCYLNVPEPNQKKVKSFSINKLCPLEKNSSLQIWAPSRFTKPPLTKANDHSLIAAFPGKFITSGDAPKKIERFWIRDNTTAKGYKLLILGHHGSKTSTSLEWLQQTRPRLALASSRRKKYGHPHQTTLSLLRRFQVPTLSTQDWGSILVKY